MALVKGNKMSNEPNTKSMLNVAKDCDLTSLSEAWNNYNIHYTLFFEIDRFSEQYNALVKEMVGYGLITVDVNGKKTLAVISIDDALKLVEDKDKENEKVKS